MLLRCYPKITDFIYLHFGQSPAVDYRFLPIYSYGFWVATGFATAAFFAVREMRRREQLGLFPHTERKYLYGAGLDITELITYFIFSFLVGFKVVGVFGSYHEALRTHALDFSEYMKSMNGSWVGGIVFALAVCGYYYYGKNKEKLPQPEERIQKLYPADYIGDLVVIAAVLGITGANFFNFLENPDDYTNFFNDPIGSLFSGLSVYGGLICAGIGFGLYARWKNFNILHFFDCICPGFMLANGLGRIGCHVSGDGDWGITNLSPKPGWLPDWLWTNSYEHNIIDSGVRMAGCMEEHCMQLAQPAYPTPIYEFAMCATIAVVLWSLRKRFTFMPGFLFFLFTISIGLQRLSIEQIRDIGGRETGGGFLGLDLRQSEFISLVMILAGIAGCLWLWRKYRGQSV